MTPPSAAPSGLPRLFPTIVHMLAAAAARTPDQAALKDPWRTLSYRQYARCVEGAARDLGRRGVGAGAVVLTLLDNAAETCVFSLAAQATGAQLCPANPAYTARELGQILEDARPQVAIVHAHREAVLREALEGLDELEVIVIERGGATPDAWADDPALVLDLTRIQPQALALLQYTGGTTGRPKGVQLTHRALATNVAQREAVLPTRMDTERVLCVMPLFHSFGMAMGLYLALACRGLLVLLERYKPQLVVDAFANEGVTIFPAGPTVFNSLLAFEPFVRAQHPDLAWCASGSAALPEATLNRWREVIGSPIYEGYGQTEAGPVLTYQGPFQARRAGAVGRPLPYTEIELAALDDPARTAGPREPGEIRARGPQIMAGYKDRPDETAAALADGWLYTGDIGVFDETGELRIVDRKKELVIVSGYNVYPREVEEVLASHPAVVETAVVGAPDAYRGEALQAFVVLNTTLAVEELRLWCAHRLAGYKQPSQIRPVEGLPRTTVGKVDKATLRNWAAGA